MRPFLRNTWNLVCLPFRMVASPEILRRFGLRSMKDERLDAVLEHCRGRLLDVGCGPHMELVRRYAGPGVGVDVFPWPEIDQVCDTRQMPFGDGVFDTVTIVAALNHVTDREAVLRECRRLLAPDGRLILTMIGPVVGYVRHRVVAGWDPDQVEREHAPGELDGMTDRHVRSLLDQAGFQLEVHNRFVCWLNHLYVARPRAELLPAAAGDRAVDNSQTGEPSENGKSPQAVSDGGMRPNVGRQA